MLVFFLLGIIIFFFFFTCVIKIKIENFLIDTISPKEKKSEIYLQVYLLGKIKIFEKGFNQLKWKNIDLIKMTEKMEWKKFKLHFLKKEERNKIISKIHLERLQLHIKIGTENAMLTSLIVPFLSTGVEIILTKLKKSQDQRNYSYKIEPDYEGKNKCKVKLDSIISMKIVHIIYILYIVLKKRRVEKNGRTSNRRSYDYSYE